MRGVETKVCQGRLSRLLSSREWRHVPTIAMCVGLTSLLAACLSPSVDFNDLPEERSTLGQMAHAIALSNAARAEVCSPEYQLSLLTDRDAMVSGVDEILTTEIVQDLPTMMAESVLPSFDDGSLEALVDAGGDALALLVDDEFDPQRQALEGISKILRTSTILQDQHVIELSRAIIAKENLSDGLHAIAGLADVADRDGLALHSLMYVLSSALSAASSAQSSCQGLAEQFSADNLLSTQGFEQASAGGSPAWVARVDSHGNPEVRISALTSTLHTPFVDGDGDGVADVDAEGLPVDANGARLEIAAFGTGAGFDSARRRVADDGSLLFEYYNAKKTSLAHGLRLAGEAIGAGVVTDAALVLDAALGEQSPCNVEGVGNCYRYGRDDNALHQLLFTLLESAKIDKPVVLLETMAALLRDNPELAEHVLVAAGRIIDAVGNSDIDVSAPQIYELVDQILPLVARIFRIRTASGVPLPRLLMDVLRELGSTARDFPQELLGAIEHTTLIKDEECSDSPPDPASPTVDFSRHRFYFINGVEVDNRSSLERSLELLADADCGSVPFTGGKSVANVIIDLMSRLAPDTVCNLIDNLLGILGVTGNIGEGAVNAALFVVGCSGDNDVEASDLFVLDDLAKSGALDFYLPIARTFREEGELAALLPIFRVVVQDLRANEDNSANTTSALRPMLPIIADVLRAGAFDPFFDLNDLLVAVPALDGDGSLADVLIDSTAHLLDDTRAINTVTGPKSNTSLAAELIDALHKIVVRVDQAGRNDALADLFAHVSGYLTRTYVDDRGTAESSDDVTRLRDAAVVPLLANLLATAAEAASLPPAQYQCYVGEWQSRAGDLVESPALAALVRLGVLLKDYPGTALAEGFIAGLLDPQEGAQLVVPYAELLRIGAEFMQTPVQVQGADQVVDYLAAVLDPRREGSQLVATLDSLLVNDQRRVLLRLLANALGPSLAPAHEAPLLKLLEVAEHYWAIDGANQCLAEVPEPPTTIELEQSVVDILSFLRDDDSLLAAIFDLLGKRSGP